MRELKLMTSKSYVSYGYQLGMEGTSRAGHMSGPLMPLVTPWTRSSRAAGRESHVQE